MGVGYSVFSDDKTTGSFIYENTVENCVSSKTLDKQIEQNSISYIKKIIHPDPDPFTPTAAPSITPTIEPTPCPKSPCEPGPCPPINPCPPNPIYPTPNVTPYPEYATCVGKLVEDCSSLNSEQACVKTPIDSSLLTYDYNKPLLYNNNKTIKTELLKTNVLNEGKQLHLTSFWDCSMGCTAHLGKQTAARNLAPMRVPDQFKSKEQEDIWMVGAGCGHFKRIGSAVEGLNNWNPECGSCILFSDSNFKNSHQSAIVMLMDQYSSDECKGHPQLDQAWV